MNNFKLIKHSVIEASFVENREKEKKNDIEIGVEGSILVPKDSENRKCLMVKLKFHFGNSEERLSLILETLSTFGIEKQSEIKEEDIQSVCLPVALAELRKTVKKVTEAYGIPVLDLPPFEEEIEEY